MKYLYSLLFLGCVVGLFVLMYNLPNNHTSNVKINFQPQKTKLFTVTGNNDTINVLATILPQFAVKLNADQFKNIWQAHAAERTSSIHAEATDIKGKTMPVKTSFDESNKQVVVTPLVSNGLKPGLYKLNVRVKTVQGQFTTITQDFTWGVMAINTNKGIYQKGENVKIGMSVLDDMGSTKCIAKNGTVNFNTAKIWLTVTSPSGQTINLSTDDGTIVGSSDCADKSVTNIADFLSHITASEVGKYKLHMVAENINGKRSIDDGFTVQEQAAPFVVERTAYPTRIYPRVEYPVTISVIANRDYDGPVTDTVPDNFGITHISDGGFTVNRDKYQLIQWNVHWKKGGMYTLQYQIKFPPVSPEFYIVGPITIGNFNDGRSWQLASDPLFTFVQENHNTAASGTSVSVTLGSAPVTNNLVIVICYRVTSNTFNTPSPGTWTSAYNNSSGPRMYMYYRVAPAGMSATMQCNTSTSGVLGIQALEFSGNATASVRDARTRRNAISCTSGTFASGTLTPGNPDVLVVSASSATTGGRSVTGHNNYTDSATSFNGTSGTFDSAWSEQINNPPVSTNDTTTYSGNAGTCDNLIVSFNSTITVSQGSFRFFDNANSATPGNPLAAQNTNITLASPNYPFRLRMLLDIDSASGTTLAQGTGDFLLEYAQMPSTNNCLDGSFTPVATDSAIAYNPNSASGGNLAPIVSSGNDPSDAATYTTVLENYMELYTDDNPDNDISNNQATISNNQAGLWDFSLIDNSQTAGTTTYCLIITDNAGGFLNAYRNIPQVTTATVDVLIRGGSTIKGAGNGGTTLIQ